MADRLPIFIMACAALAAAGSMLVSCVAPETGPHVPPDLSGLQCRALVGDHFLPCNQVEPSVYPAEWWAMGREV